MSTATGTRKVNTCRGMSRPTSRTVWVMELRSWSGLVEMGALSLLIRASEL
jgi:hypothetical protein